MLAEGQEEEAILELEDRSRRLAPDLGRRFPPAQAARDHQVQDQKEIILQAEDNALADTAETTHSFPLRVKQIGFHGPHDKGTGAIAHVEVSLGQIQLGTHFIDIIQIRQIEFLIIGVWGGKRRVYASFKFFLYTLLGSVLMLLAMFAMFSTAGTADIPTLIEVGSSKFSPEMQWWLFLAFLASFAVKMPMWPVHTWLPDAHVEAPTAGSVILAAILLKMGGYGFLRFSVPMFPIASQELAPFVFTLSVIAIVYTSLVALAQEDIKKLIAYSSVAHMGFVTMGLFTFTVRELFMLLMTVLKALLHRLDGEVEIKAESIR